VEAVVRVHPFNASGHRENEALSRNIGLGSWTTLSFPLPAAAFRGPLRIQPADRSCIVEVGEIKVSDGQTGRIMAAMSDVSALRQILLVDSLSLLPSEEKYLLLCHGSDPQLEVSLTVDTRGPCRLEIALRIDAEPAAVAKTVTTQLQREHAANAAKMAEEIQLLKVELKAAQSERLVLAAEVSQLATDKMQAIREKEEVLESARRQAGQDESDRRELTAKIAQLRSERAQRIKDLEIELEREKAVIRGVERSLSWRVTAPVRKTMEALRKVRNGGSSGVGT
jgi:hypothetical protein